MKLKILIYILWLLPLLCTAKAPIDWYGYHQPPAVFMSGTDKGIGFVDQIQKIIIKNLPQYEHRIHKVTMGRTMHDMKAGKTVCNPALFNTPTRQIFVTFSNYSVMHPNLQVVMKNTLANSLKLDTEVDLNLLFKHHKLIMSRVASRSYGHYLDNILLQYNSLINDRASDSNFALFKMLESDRIDFIISYPSVANYAILKLQSKHQYRTLKIKGVAPYVMGSIGCSKTPWGEKVIADINKVLAKLKITDAYFNAISSWQNQQTLNQEYRNFYQKNFINNLKIGL